ncbi:MAG: cyclase [Candidatus Viridilinea halotolerans]|uniref:Cyclase n=1 Tax=Candidatus Viridilinea halotolerans TaxID=2491704 RepID=A0A426U3L1_9CHLR|nr:MAG: cyclase [Candidatus Viridilinea halotolerans]
MIKAIRRAFIQQTTPQAIFTALSDPQSIVEFLPRMKRAELLERDDELRKARLVTYMGVGGLFGTIRCEGDLSWEENREIHFLVRTPLPVETHWLLTPEGDGVNIEAMMGLNLEPMLGPMAAFVPERQVSDLLAGELESALSSLTKRMGEIGAEQRERAVAL